MALSTDSAVYFDPYHVEVIKDPSQTFRRLRMYYNAQHDLSPTSTVRGWDVMPAVSA